MTTASRPVHPVALLTDFGLEDVYVGVMKGVVETLAPGAPVLDLCHAVEPQAVDEAAFLLDQAIPYLPAGSVVCAVCDPGVGTDRRPVAVEAGPFRLVAPDNGLLGLCLGWLEPGAAVVVDREAIPEPAPAVGGRPPSVTFDGRDLFAPAAALLARGDPLDDLGPPLDPTDLVPAPPIGPRVVHVDRFGTLVTGIPGADLPASPRIRVGGETVERVVRTFAEAERGGLVGLIGSSGHLEIAVVGGSARRRLGVERGAEVEVEAR